MKLEMEITKEHEDGGADCSVEMDEEAKNWLLTIGLEAIIRNATDTANLSPLKTDKGPDPWPIAVMAAQEFIDNSPPAELGIYTIRKAFEMGFLRGYDHAKNIG